MDVLNGLIYVMTTFCVKQLFSKLVN